MGNREFKLDLQRRRLLCGSEKAIIEQLLESRLCHALPSLKVHVYYDELFFGRSYYRLHRDMDKPVFLLGRGHRVLFHDPASVYFLASELYPGDEDAVSSGLYHISLDQQCTADPQFRKTLEIMAANRKRRKRTPRQTDPNLKWLKKLEELKRLYRLLHG